MQIQWPPEKASPPTQPPIRTTSILPRTPADLPLPIADTEADGKIMEKFAADNLNFKGRGLFRRKTSVRDMLSWSSRAITRPMLASARGKQNAKAALDMFKLVQVYMGDRKARPGTSLNSVLIEILSAAFSTPA